MWLAQKACRQIDACFHERGQHLQKIGRDTVPDSPWVPEVVTHEENGGQIRD
jgi:hypothetical protein